MKIRKNHFNLIEILLTIAVIAFGVIVVLGMLPKGLRASRNVATVSYASGVIEEIGGFLQLNGADSVESDSFEDTEAAVDEEEIMESYAALVEFINNPTALNASLSNIYQPFSIGLFKYKNLDDVYIAVMGDSREIDGERENRLDFSGMIRICKKENPEGSFVAIKHDGDPAAPTHECFDGADQKCGYDEADFEVRTRNMNCATVYVELSYPLSLPYEDRTKVYYSFDVKK